MLVKEFISKTERDYMITTLLKYYKVQNVKWKYKNIKDHAHFEVETGTLQLSTRYKKIKPNQIKDFLVTMVHEIDHAMMAKKYGWKKFKEMWEYEANKIEQGYYPGKTDAYDDNPYELKAEEFGQKNYKKWYNTFKKQDLF